MRMLVLLATLLLSGCATTDLINQIQMPDPPVQLMVPAQALKSLPVGPVKANDVLANDVDNTAISKLNSLELTELQAWIKQTKANIDASNKKNKKLK